MAHPRDRARWSDTDLLAGIAVCDDRACPALHRRHLSPDVSVLMKRTGDPELTAEVGAALARSELVARRRASRGPARLGPGARERVSVDC